MEAKDIAKEKRLNNRAWLMNNLADILREATYHKAHKDDFGYGTGKVLWSWTEEQGSCKTEYVE